MAKKRTYKAGNEVYEIPEKESKSFLEDFPNAVEIQSYTFQGDTFDIPTNEVNDFLVDFPEAKPLKKKGPVSVLPEDTGTFPSLGERIRRENGDLPEGFRTIDPKELKVEMPEKFEYFWAYSPEEEAEMSARAKRVYQYGELLDEQIPALTEERDKSREIYESLSPEYRKLLLKGERRDEEEQERFQSLEKEIKNNFNKSEDLTTSLYLLNSAKKYIETSDAGVLESMVRSDAWINLLDFGLGEILTQFDVLDLAKRFEAGEELSKEEQTALFAYGLRQAVHQDTEKTMSSMIGSGIAETIPFMVQFAASGPAASTGKKAATEMVEQLIKKTGKDRLAKYTANAIGSLTGSIVRVPYMSSFYEGIAANQIGQVQPEITKEGELKGIPIEETQMSPLKATRQSFASTLVTTMTETFGAGINKVTTKLLNKIPNNPMVNRINNKLLDNIKSATGFNGWMGEFTEEILEAHGQAVIDRDQKLADIWDRKSLLSTAIVTGIISGAFTGASYVTKGNASDKAMVVRDLRESQTAIGPERAGEIDTILRGDNQETNIEQLDEYINRRRAAGATEEELGNIINYAVNRSRLDSMNAAVVETQDEVDALREEEAPPEAEIEAVEEAVAPPVEEVPTEVPEAVGPAEIAEEQPPVELTPEEQKREEARRNVIEDKARLDSLTVEEARALPEVVENRGNEAFEVFDTIDWDNKQDIRDKFDEISFIINGKRGDLETYLRGISNLTDETDIWSKDYIERYIIARTKDISGVEVAPEVEQKLIDKQKTEDYARKKLQVQEREVIEEEVGEGVREEEAREGVREGEKEVILTSPEHSGLVRLALEAESPRGFISALRQSGLSEKTKKKYINAYFAEDKTASESAQDFINDVKQKYAEEEQGRQVREEGPEARPVEGVRDQDLSEVYGAGVQDRQKEQERSLQEIGDIRQKGAAQLISEAQSTNELDYLRDTGQIVENEAFRDRRKALEAEGKVRDTAGRSLMIEAQRAVNISEEIERSMAEDVGEDRMADLREKRSQLVDSALGRLGRVANIRFAVGEEGSTADVVKELAMAIRELAEAGIINLELGTRQAIDKVKKYFGDDNPEVQALIEENADAIAEELEREVKPKPKPKRAKPKPKPEPPTGERTPGEVVQQMMESERQAIEEVTPKRGQEFIKWFRKLFVDPSENFRAAMIRTDRDFGRRASDYFNLQAGVSGRNNREFSKARERILGKWGKTLSQGEQKALERYLQLNRIVELDQLYDKRGDERLQHPNGVNLEEAQSVIDAMMANDKKVLEQFGLEALDMNKIMQRAEAYYDVMRNNLKKLYEAGLINAQAYEKLRDEQPYYSRREYIDNFVDEVERQGNISGLQELSSGSFGAMLTDLQTLLADNISRTNQAIARNDTMRALRDFAEANPDNGIIEVAGVTQEYYNKIAEQEELPEGERKYIPPQWEDTPTGYTSYNYRDNGREARLFINNDYVEEFEREGDPEALSRTKNILSWVSGNKILKAFATGYNPEFMVKNIPLDMLHILTTTDEYSPYYPVATAQMLSDMKKVLGDVLRRKGRFEDYVREGGSMDFLTTQGSLTPAKFKRYTKMSQGMRALADVAQYLGNTSEILTRLALRERIIDNRVKQFEKENGRKPNKEEMQDIHKRATAGARNYLDFSQGGKAIQLFNSVIPYLNAGFQVTRGNMRAFHNNPKLYMKKMGQLAATATALTLYNLGNYGGGDEEEKEERKRYYLDDIPDRVKADNFVIMTPISYIDDKGNKRYIYFKFPKDNFQKSITGVFEGIASESVGVKGQLLNERRFMELQSMIQNFGDLGNAPPVMRAKKGYEMNMDFYFQEPIWKGRDFGKDPSLEFTPGKTPERFIKFGEMTGLSPVRSQYFAQQFTTRSNVLGSMIGEGLDFAAAGVDKEIKNELDQSVAEKIIKSPFSRRFFKSTSPYAKESPAKEAVQQYNREKQKMDNHLKKMVDRGDSEDKIMEWIVGIDDPKESNRMMDRYISGIEKGNIDFRVKEMGYTYSKPRALAFYKYYKEADKEGKDKLIEQSLRLGGVITAGEFQRELRDYFASDGEIDIKDFESRMKKLAKKVAKEKKKRYKEISSSLKAALQEKKREKNE